MNKTSRPSQEALIKPDEIATPLPDSDVAEIYGVVTKRINEAVKNNPDKFPEGYLIDLSYVE